MVIGLILPKMNANVFRCEAAWFLHCVFKCASPVCSACVCSWQRESTNMARCWQFSFIYSVVFFQHFFENFVCVGEIETEGAYVTCQNSKNPHLCWKGTVKPGWWEHRDNIAIVQCINIQQRVSGPGRKWAD